MFWGVVLEVVYGVCVLMYVASGRRSSHIHHTSLNQAARMTRCAVNQYLWEHLYISLISGTMSSKPTHQDFLFQMDKSFCTEIWAAERFEFKKCYMEQHRDFWENILPLTKRKSLHIWPWSSCDREKTEIRNFRSYQICYKEEEKKDFLNEVIGQVSQMIVWMVLSWSLLDKLV